MSKAIWLCAALLGGLMSGVVKAEDNTAIITVKVVINAVPCAINNNQMIDVDFGNNVITTDVAAGKVEKPVNYTLDCTNAITSRTLKMRITGEGAGFDSALLKTNMPALGIKIKADGLNYPINTNLPLASTTAKPALTAQLTQQPGAHLPTGAFTAGATMTVDYQ